jgi:ankyrin repeat protein
MVLGLTFNLKSMGKANHIAPRSFFSNINLQGNNNNNSGSRSSNNNTTELQPQQQEQITQSVKRTTAARSVASSSSYSTYYMEDPQQISELDLVEISLQEDAVYTYTEEELSEFLIDAAKEGKLEDFKRLCEEFRANPDLPGYMGWTPGHWAARHGHLNILDYLKLYGANLDMLDKKGDSLLHKAAVNAKYRTCQWLLEQGFNVQCRNNHVST